MASAETKIIYHLDDQETPYLVKLPVAAERVTLGDFKALLNRPNYKFYFKSMDDDFGRSAPPPSFDLSIATLRGARECPTPCSVNFVVVQ
ncbi:UNVERIFIED_CONTAM: hypothetical protein K2H54_062393 [Gekko kuhli]